MIQKCVYASVMKTHSYSKLIVCFRFCIYSVFSFLVYVWNDFVVAEVFNRTPQNLQNSVAKEFYAKKNFKFFFILNIIFNTVFIWWSNIFVEWMNISIAKNDWKFFFFLCVQISHLNIRMRFFSLFSRWLFGQKNTK